MSGGSGIGVPINVTSALSTSTVVEVAGAERVTQNESVKIVAYNTDYPNTDFTVKILRRPAISSKSPTTDYVVEEYTSTSDSSGLISFDWSPPTTTANFSGSFFRYYPAVWVGSEDPAVASDNIDISVFDKTTILIDDVDTGLGPAQAIPVYTEVSKDSTVVTGTAGRSVYDFTWDNWNALFSPVVYTLTEEAEELQTLGTDYSINYKQGKVTFLDNALGEHVEVEASYVFKYFADATIRKFLDQSLSMMNFVAPYTSYTLSSYPDYWRYAIVCGGIMIGLEQLFQAPLYRERRLLFADADIIGTLGAYYDRIKTSFQQDFMAKKARWSLVMPRGISGHDIIAPPRVTAQSYQSWAYLRGRGI